MQRKRIVALLTLMCMMLSGCSASQQLENQAFVILLGIDKSENGNIKLTAQIPKIAGKSGGSEGGGDESNYMIATTEGQTFSEALELLSVAVPRRINLTQVKLIAVGEELAQDEKFGGIMQEISGTYQLYGTAHMVVCRGSVGNFIKNQKPVIGRRVSTAIIALLDHYKEQGYIPESTFADVHYQTNSIYSDPLVILAGTALEEGTPAREIPPEIFPEEVPAQLEDDKNRYLGAAIMRDGRMVGELTAREMLFANLIRGRTMKFNYTSDGITVNLTTEKAPKITIDTSGDPIQIKYEQTLLAVPLTEMPDERTLSDALESDFMRVIEKCQTLEVEPFFLADKAAGEFCTIEEWQEYRWRQRFTSANIEIEIRVRRLNE